MPDDKNLDLSFMVGVPSKAPDMAALIKEAQVPKTAPAEAQVPKKKSEKSPIGVLTYIFQIWHTRGIIPDVDEIHEATGETKTFIRHCFDDEEFRSALSRQGVHYDPDPMKSKLALHPIQIAFVDMLLNIYDKRTIRQKMEELGVKPQTYNGWQKNPVFKQYLQTRATQLFGEIEPIARVRLAEAVEEGDQNAIKLVLEMLGSYTPKIKMEVDVHMVIAKVQELIVKYITDPNILAQFADELDGIIQGELAS